MTTLDQMGLSRSRRNAEFLLAHLKSLSGRLAMRLTGNRPPTSELLALAVSHANCRPASEDDDCWVSLDRGFIVPVDDVRDLLPPLQVGDGDDGTQARPDLIYVTMRSRGRDSCFDSSRSSTAGICGWRERRKYCGRFTSRPSRSINVGTTGTLTKKSAPRSERFDAPNLPECCASTRTRHTGITCRRRGTRRSHPRSTA